ncbi:microviridin/marinostatin family tricyclic proteinase inhibitor [Microcoleus sp. FACHB-68]|uniref:microviridin/marinostatin family tricyclic proteinase inhibitor n=1 Tax=Microcoleus sp. FACHB-68 TaxID=2692826 RepID=UPI001685922C|nr:microviridin/marinostatin family tricyclic proteinase inhibitor [Microcoleus sp. FACHB-68]MBD1939416.1 microviridin/marinostatin family tricyclic proteinase inhibitor [Microcoleus sp. FACHB-68]
MSEMPNEKAVPFFARFLESQNIEELSEEDMEAAAGGKCRKKSKCNGGGIAVTEKYPSDQEEGGDVTTTKYPSDAEDEGEVMVTMKYPSDAEDSGGCL